MSRDFSWEVYHSLVIRRFAVEPSEITAAVGLEPKTVLRKGESSRPGRPPVVMNVWSYNTPERTLTTDQMNAESGKALLDLVAHLWRRRDRLAALGEGVEAWVETVVDSDSPRIVWGLEPEVMRRLAEMNMSHVVITWSGGDDETDRWFSPACVARSASRPFSWLRRRLARSS